MTKQPFDEQYADVLVPQDDQALRNIVGDLDAVARAITLPTHAIAPPSFVRATNPRSMSRWTPRMTWWGSARRVAAVALLCVMLVVGTAWALLPQLQEVLSRLPNTQRLAVEQRGTPLDQSQTVDGFTVTMRYVYADAYQIVVAYSLSAPPGRTIHQFQLAGRAENGLSSMQLRNRPVLTDDAGHAFRPIGEDGTELRDSTGTILLHYEPGQIDQRELHLQFAVGAINLIERVVPHNEPANAYHCEPMSGGSDLICFVAVPASMTFSFSVPVEPSRRIAVNQTVTSGGTAVTLEQLLIAPTGVVARLRGAYNASVDLELNGQSYALGGEEFIPLLDPDAAPDTIVWEPYADAHLIDQQGEAVVTVRAGPRLPNFPAMPGGPWQFRFTVP